MVQNVLRELNINPIRLNKENFCIGLTIDLVRHMWCLQTPADSKFANRIIIPAQLYLKMMIFGQERERRSRYNRVGNS